MFYELLSNPSVSRSACQFARPDCLPGWESLARMGVFDIDAWVRMRPNTKFSGRNEALQLP